MANHDFSCPDCGHVAQDVVIPTGQRAGLHRVGCSACGTRMEWVPGRTAMDAGSGPGFTSFTARDGRNELVLIDSLAKLRQVERESEALARNGEGQQIVWRHYSNTRSNREVNTLGPSPAERPNPAFVEKFGPHIKSAEDPNLAFGPGVSEDNCSALQGGCELPEPEPVVAPVGTPTS